jgi:hydrophobic/amphiphilic exporter-1 (mainly G- bacteria), HAE1 family
MQKLAEICVRRPVFATVLIVALTVVGIFSFFSLGVDLFPKVDFPVVTITVVNPGASPQEVETEVTDKVEAAVNTISGIDELRSTSVEGVSQVFVTFFLDKNADVAAQEVRDKVNLILRDLPETAEEPVIQKLDADAAPVLRIAVSAPLSLRDVTEIADKQIKQRIESINGVGQVQIVGGQEREIHIWLDPDKMRAYNVTVAEVANAVGLQNTEVPGGRVDEGTRELTVRTMGRLREPEEFNNIAVATRGTYAVKLSDIGRAADESEEQRTAAYLNGAPAVTLVVAKQSGQNTIAVADAVKERLAEIAQTLPADFRTQIVGDQSIFIKAAVDSIKTHLVEGGILAAIVVFLFLWNFRLTMIAAIAIPTSIIATFGVMSALDFTLNQITMLALTLMVGIVIDDAIVVLENIYRFIEEKGMSPFQAAIEGTREIGLAVMATTLSLLAVFIPVGFMGGMVGRFMSSFGLTASSAIAVSLLVSFTLTPMLCARLIKRREAALATASGEGDLGEGELRGGAGARPEATGAEQNTATALQGSKESRFYGAIDRTYTKMLHWSLAHRWMVVALCAVVILSIVPLFMLVGKNFLPVDDQSQFEVSVRTSEGSTLAATTTVVQRIATDLHKLPGVTDTLVTVGGGQQEVVNTASIYVKLADIKDRGASQEELMVRARDLMKRYPKELRTSIQQVAAISGGGQRNADIQYVVSGPDLGKLGTYSEALLEKMKTIPDVVDADSSLISGKPELRVQIDRARAADLGVRVGDVAQALNTLVAGQKISTFNEGKDQYDVVVRATGEYRAGPEGLQRMIVASTKGGWVSLDNVVKIEQGTGPSSIDRLNRQRQVTLSANVKPGGSQAAVMQQLDGFVKEIKVDPGYTTGPAGRSKELARSGYYFMLAFALSFIFMYLVLAAQFESFIHPVTILLTLPLAIPFGILSLLLTGQTVNIFSGLGLLLLFGVVKKNAILQIDHTNGLRASGMTRADAIIQANRDRLRPILMTTIALVAGMIPLVVSSGPGSGTNRSIGVLVVGGQSLCLLLTLLAVPVFYSLFEDLKDLPAWGYIGERYRKATLFARSRLSKFGAGLRGGQSPNNRGGNAQGGNPQGSYPHRDVVSRKTERDKYADQISGD